MEDSLPVEEQPALDLVLESSNDVREVLVDANPVVARPLPTLAALEYVESVVEEAPVVNPVILDIVPEEVPAAQPEEVEEPKSPGVVQQEPAVERTNEESASDVPESIVISAELTLRQVPPVDPELVTVTQEVEAVVDEVEPQQVPLVISEPVEVEYDVQVPDALQEEAKQVDRPWTPSYSVSSQGGGSDNVVAADEGNAEPSIVPEPPVEEPAAPAYVTTIPAEVCVLDVSFPP